MHTNLYTDFSSDVYDTIFRLTPIRRGKKAEFKNTFEFLHKRKISQTKNNNSI